MNRLTHITRRSFAKIALATGSLGALTLFGCANPLQAGKKQQGAQQADRKTLARAAGVQPGKTLADFEKTTTSLKAGQVPKSPQQYPRESITFFAFDTVISIEAFCAQEVLQHLENQCAYFECLFSRTVKGSDISNINAAQGASIQVSPETADVIARSIEYSKQTNGAFDITVGTITTLWDFKEKIIPAQHDIDEGLLYVGYEHIYQDKTNIALDNPHTKLDLGGVAKGYIADYLCAMLIEAGCDSGFVNLGGNVKSVGARPDGSPWNIGIQDPNKDDQEIFASVPAQDMSVVTSGLYERTFEKDGTSYWHILDPKTGYPIQSDIQSATILSQKSVDGDPLATALFVMGKEKALQFVEALDGVEAILVDTTGAMHISANVELNSIL